MPPAHRLWPSSPQGLDGHSLFPPSPGLQAAPAYFTKGACPNDLLDLDTRGIHLPGKLPDGLAGVLVRGGVDVILHPKSWTAVLLQLLCVARPTPLPPQHDSQHGDGRQQEEGQGPQDGPNYQGESLWQLGGQLTLRQCLEIDLAPVGAVACGSPRPHLEAIDVARAQLGHGGRVGLAGQGEGVGFIFCLVVVAELIVQDIPVSLVWLWPGHRDAVGCPAHLVQCRDCRGNCVAGADIDGGSLGRVGTEL